MKKVLIITYYWPPSGGSGVQRWLKFVKYFRDFGIEPIVLTVDPDFATFPNFDYTLQNEIPEEIEIHKTKAKSPFALYLKVRQKEVPKVGFSGEKKPGLTEKIMRFIRGNFFIPDARIGWNSFALDKAREIIITNNIEYVITTSPPHSTQMIGLALKNEFNVKWIADLRDPWTEIYYNKELYRTRFAKKKDYRLEQACLQKADKIVVVSQEIKRHFGADRTEILNKISVIPNGFDEDDFLKVESEELTNKIEMESGNLKSEFSTDKVISYVGNLGEQYPIKGFLEAFSEVLKKESNWRLQFVGNCHFGVKTIIEKLNISKSVTFIPYVNHIEAIEYMSKAKILLLIIPEIENNKGILTGKLFEYLATGNPIINIGPKDGDAATILSENAISSTVDSNESDKMVEFILNSHNKLDAIKRSDKFSRRNLTKEMAKLILD
ncbi:MAG: glycosyltransferase family 4 protein [Crocinitomicaceae bacterium]